MNTSTAATMPASTAQALMLRALELAARGPRRDANPRVGCVLVDRAGTVVGEGWHRGAGTAHAEVVALAQAGDAARGGTAVVTLEPCDHTGRTGPCSAALLRAGIARVVIGQRDPDPLAAGGADTLARAGVAVVQGPLAEQAQALNRYWSHAVATGRPFVTWKFAATLDGRSAAADGSSRWITGEPARADAHRRRAEAGALLVGTGTALADDPQLTVRTPAEAGAVTGPDPADGPPPLRVVLGERDLPDGARLRDGAAGTLQLRHRDPAAALAELAARQVRHVWLEGGPTLAAAFWRAHLVDEVVAYLAPALLGSGAPAVSDLGIATIEDTARLELVDLARLGPDLRLVLAPARIGGE